MLVRRTPVRPVLLRSAACVLAATLSAPLGHLPSRAQETAVRVTAQAGVGGYVDPAAPVELVVRVEADVLFTGSIEVTQGGSTVRLPAEVPAGSEKRFGVLLPPLVVGQPTRVRLVPSGGEEPVASTTLSIDVPDAELLVGVAGVDGLEAVLGTVRTEIGGLPVRAIPLDDLERDLRPLGYLVLGAGAEASGALSGWVESGGRLVTAPAQADALGLSLVELGTVPRAGAEWFRAGRGEVLIVEDPLSFDRWASLLRPVPLRLGARDVWQTPDRPLANAAANGGDQRTPSLPWLFGAIVGYAALVGPVNFLVLRRLRRRDLAWITVPVIGLLTMGGFWLAGRERLQGVVMNHASVLVGGEVATARSSLVLATGTAGRHRVGFDEGWLVYPGQVGDVVDQVGQPVAAAAAEVVGSEVAFDLPQLGFAAVHAVHRPQGLPRVSLVPDPAGGVVEVENGSGLDFWAWGVAGGGAPRVAPGSLPAGASETIRLPGVGAGREGVGNVGDAVVQARRMWDDDRSWRVLYPLAEALGFLLDAPMDPFFFGFTETHRLEVDLDGVPTRVAGTSLVVVPLSSPEEPAAGVGRARGELVATGDAAWVDRGPGFLFVSTDAMVVRFRLPADLAVDPELAFLGMFGERPGGFEAWDWQQGTFRPVEAGSRLDRASHVAPSGEVMLRLLAPGAGEDLPVESPMSPASVELRWSA